MTDHLYIFDTTLRDGEQSPGASMTKNEKVHIAKMLEAMRVDIIEAGFPAASPGDLDAVHTVATTIQNSTVCALARAIPRDIAQAAAALKGCVRPRIHTFIASSPIHMEKKLQMTPDQVIEAAVRAIKQARQHTDDVEFSPEDAGRSDPDFLCRLIDQAIAAGATTINIPDTVGYTLPAQFGGLIKYLLANIPDSDKVIFSVHCHDDFGLAAANSLTAVQNGARQIECTINGLGERAGNTALEEVVMAVRVRRDLFDCDTRIDTSKIVAASQLVSQITGFPVQPNKAIVGINAFAHEAGIHQDGVIKHRETYEIMRAEDVGWRTNRLVLGKHSGRAALKQRCEAIGIDCSNTTTFNTLFAAFKALADKKHDVYDNDLHALANQLGKYVDNVPLSLTHCSFRAAIEHQPHAAITLTIRDENSEDVICRSAEASGDGVVDAVFSAIKNIVPHDASLELYTVNSITGGTDAQGEVTVRLRNEHGVFSGTGADTDIIIASAKAYVDALNEVWRHTPRRHAQL